MTPELWTAVLGVGGLAAIVPKVIDGVSAWRTGRAADEKTKNQSLLQRTVAAEQRAENEAEYRRQVEEYAGRLRVFLVDLGVPADGLPAWPDRKQR